MLICSWTFLQKCLAVSRAGTEVRFILLILYPIFSRLRKWRWVILGFQSLTAHNEPLFTYCSLLILISTIYFIFNSFLHWLLPPFFFVYPLPFHFVLFFRLWLTIYFVLTLNTQHCTFDTIVHWDSSTHLTFFRWVLPQLALLPLKPGYLIDLYHPGAQHTLWFSPFFLCVDICRLYIVPLPLCRSKHKANKAIFFSFTKLELCIDPSLCSSWMLSF